MSDKSGKCKQPSREEAQDKWEKHPVNSGGLESKASSKEQPVEAGSSSKNASVPSVGQPLPDVGRAQNASMVTASPRLPATHVTVIIRFPHGDVYLPLFVVGRYPMFAEMFQGGLLQWPGVSQRQALIITHYLRDPKPKYKMVRYDTSAEHEDRLEREFVDALVINAQATCFNLHELAGLALDHMELYGVMIPLARVTVNFMAQGEWYQRNRAYVQSYLTRRSTSIHPLAIHHDRGGFGLQTGDAVIDGLLGAINNLRFAAPYPHPYY
ncbi:hypothetical protein FCIRC_3281 [Fusarium circinatum]|uniref:Uncharacterized protein n=1 Tax=Fusarium circinatum TaxID=48490 RepID=A0A8H5UGL6_FUSCI|nr:hypothetical protein FCIRC_3281 [Fusarium circinatum]